MHAVGHFFYHAVFAGLSQPRLQPTFQKGIGQKLRPGQTPLVTHLGEWSSQHEVTTLKVKPTVLFVSTKFNTVQNFGFFVLCCGNIQQAAHCVEGHKQLDRNYSIWSHYFICAA